jgi:hypothetical protein
VTETVTIRGVTYPSQKAAADALGVSRSTVSSAKMRNTLDGVGLGPLQKGCDGNYKKPIAFNDVEWPTRRALADHLGVRPSELCAYFKVRDAMMRDT